MHAYHHMTRNDKVRMKARGWIFLTLVAGVEFGRTFLEISMLWCLTPSTFKCSWGWHAYFLNQGRNQDSNMRGAEYKPKLDWYLCHGDFSIFFEEFSKIRKLIIEFGNVWTSNIGVQIIYIIFCLLKKNQTLQFTFS